MAIPALAIAAGGTWLLLFNRHTIVGAVFQRDVLNAFLVPILAAMAYHLWAIVDAYRVAGGSFRPRAWVAGRLAWIGPAMVAVVLVTTVGIHGQMAVADAQGLQCSPTLSAGCPNSLP